MTTAIVAVITGVFGILTIWVQARVHRDNRNDHAATAAVVQTTAAAVELDRRAVRDQGRDQGRESRPQGPFATPADRRSRRARRAAEAPTEEASMTAAKFYTALTAALGVAVSVASDGVITLADGLAIAAAAVGALGVYVTPNKPKQ
ncbi:hypothetical protein EBZ38_15275 [bacterium]|nr:hypothetical protein [bacterium]